MSSLAIKILFFSLVMFSAGAVLADSPDSGQPTGSNDSDSQDSAYDDNIPGEEVTTDSGKKVKLWSTRGPVSTGDAPSAPTAPQLNTGSQPLPAGVGVIVDERGGIIRGGVPRR